MDARNRAAEYYDANPVFPNDVPFYLARIPSPRARILELGCGTGRVLDSLVGACGYIHGIDHSEEMLARCLAKGPELVAQFKLAVGKGTGRRRKTARMVP